MSALVRGDARGLSEGFRSPSAIERREDPGMVEPDDRRLEVPADAIRLIDQLREAPRPYSRLAPGRPPGAPLSSAAA